MPVGWLPAVGTEYSVFALPGVIMAILFASDSVNHRLPSGPRATWLGNAPEVGEGYSMIE